jgi:HlyD family secretion protein
MADQQLAPSPFRQSALDRLSSPEQLDQMVRVSDAKGWIAASGIALFVAFIVAWGIFGSVPTEVEAPGILVLQGGRLMNVPSPAGGVITQLRVHAGDSVKQGDVVATVRQVEQEQRLADATQTMHERENTLAVRREALDHEMASRRQNAEIRRNVQRQTIGYTEQRIERLRSQLAIRQDLRRQNLAVEDRVESARSELALAEQQLSDSRARLTEIDAALLDADINQQREIDSLTQTVADARRTVGELTQHLKLSNAVVAPADGRVTELTTGEGSTVEAGVSILNIETVGSLLQATVYIPIETGKKVVPGMVVHVSPSTVRREEYGMLQGIVVAVSSFPSTPQGMHAVLQNQRLVDTFAGSGPPYEARIDLQPAATPTGYAWTSGAGPRTDLTSGTPLKSYITIQSDPPVVLLLPFLKFLFEAHR